MAPNPSNKRITLSDVAAEAGVAISTVSGVLRDRAWCSVSDGTRRVVLDAAEKVGYRPNLLARSLRGEGTRTLGVVMPSFSQSLMTDARLQSVENAAWQRGYRLIVGTHQLDRRRFENLLDEMLARRVDGVVFWSIAPEDLDLVDRVRRAVSAVAAIDAHSSFDIAGVNIDRAHGGREQLRHLVAIGRRHPALLLTSHKGHTGQDKVRGLREAAAEAGMDFNRMPQIEGVCRDGDHAKLGRHLAQQLLARGDHFDALITLSDNIALGAIAALVDAGRRVPHDVAVVGFDDEQSPYGQVIPLTTIHQPRNIGEALFDALLPQLEKVSGAGPRRVVLQPHLVVRQSTVDNAGHGPQLPGPGVA